MIECPFLHMNRDVNKQFFIGISIAKHYHFNSEFIQWMCIFLQTLFIQRIFVECSNGKAYKIKDVTDGYLGEPIIRNILIPYKVAEYVHLLI